MSLDIGHGVVTRGRDEGTTVTTRDLDFEDVDHETGIGVWRRSRDSDLFGRTELGEHRTDTG